METIELLDSEIFPRLYRGLDVTFPEFAFRKREKYWIATSGVCPECQGKPHHLYCYEDHPFCLKCQRCGGLVSWWTYVQSKDGLTNQETLMKLAELSGYPLAGNHSANYEHLDKSRKRAEIFEDIMVWARNQLPGCKSAMDYLIKERCYFEKEIEQMGLGYLPSQKEMRDYLRKKGYSDADIDDTGISTLGDDHNIIMGYRDAVGRLVGVVGRVIGKSKEGVRKYMGNRGLDKSSPFNLHVARQFNHIIGMEGYLDPLILSARGMENVIGIGGTTLTMSQIRWLNNCGVKYTTLIPDNDEQGFKGLESSLSNIEQDSGIKTFVAELPARYQDPDQFVKANGIDAFKEILKSEIKSAKWKATRIISRHDLSMEIEREKAISELIQYWESLKDSIDRIDVQRFVVEQLDIPTHVFEDVAKSYEEKKQSERQEKTIINFEKQLARLIQDNKIQEAWEVIRNKPVEIEREFFIIKAESLSKENTDPLIDEFYRIKDLAIPTGLPDLDQYLAGGLRPKRLYLVGGIPGSGKTTWLVQIADRYAMKGQEVLFISLEESTIDLLNRSIIRVGGLQKSKILTWDYDINAYKSKADAYLKQIGDRLRIVEAGANFKISNIEIVVRDIIATKGRSPLVIVDYLQRIPPSTREEKSDIKRAVSGNIWRLKLIARDYNCPVIVVSNLNREAYQRGQKANLAIFKESGDIEFTADTAMAFLFTDRQGNLLGDNKLCEEMGKDRSIVTFAILKNRIGRTGSPNFVFDKERCLFQPAISEPDYRDESVAEVLR